MADRDPLSDCTGFEWDEGNATKVWERHQVSRSECEETFFHEPLVVAPDTVHSQAESRYYALGRTIADRRLFVVFTVRGDRIRVISARPMTRRERRIYDQAQEAGKQ